MDVIYNEDCISVLKRLSDNSIDAIVTDPPYNLGFMGKKWDKTGMAFGLELWKECLRVIKPGGNLLSFGGTRTYHRMVCAIEDAGFEIRDCIMWVYGSGFPKSLNIGKAIQKQQGIQLSDTGIVSPISRPNVMEDLYKSGKVGKNFTYKNVTTPEAKLWEGYGTALKPAYEPIIVAMKPLDGTFAENCLKWGVGGLNIDGCRIPYQSEQDRSGWSKTGADGSKGYQQTNTFKIRPITAEEIQDRCVNKGRFPSNLIHDGSQEVMELFPETRTGGRICKTDCGNLYLVKEKSIQ